MSKGSEGRAETERQGRQGLPVVVVVARPAEEELTFLASPDTMKACDQTTGCFLLSSLRNLLGLFLLHTDCMSLNFLGSWAKKISEHIKCRI